MSGSSNSFWRWKARAFEILVLLALVLGSCLYRSANAEKRSLERLKRLADAINAYCDANRHFPQASVIGPDGKTPHSWRIELLPYLGYKDLYASYRANEPWDSPANARLLNQMPECFLSPFDNPSSTNSGFFAVVGDGAVFNPTKATSPHQISDRPNTLVLVESKRDIPWTKPEDIPFNLREPAPDFGGFVEGKFAFATLSGDAYVADKKRVEGQIPLLVLRGAGVPYDFARTFTDPWWPLPERHAYPPDKTGQTKFNLETLAVAFHNYDDARRNGKFMNYFPRASEMGGGPVSYDRTLFAMTHPSGIRRGPQYVSWRVELLPYLNRLDLYMQFRFDEPWDSPANQKVLAQMPDVFRSPFDNPKSTNSGYYAVVGPGAVFDQRPVPREELKNKAVLFVEAKRDTPWTKPEDIPFDANDPAPRIDGFAEEDFAFVALDWKAHVVKKDLLKQKVKSLILRAGPHDIQLP